MQGLSLVPGNSGRHHHQFLQQTQASYWQRPVEFRSHWIPDTLAEATMRQCKHARLYNEGMPGRLTTTKALD